MMLKCGKRNVILAEVKSSDILAIIHSDLSYNDVVNISNNIKTNIAEIMNVDWDDELTPYKAPNPFSKKKPFGGNMNSYQDEFIETIVPAILQSLNPEIKHIVLAGYSLGGLFSFDTAIRESGVDGLVSCSSSFWYPDYYEKMRNKIKTINHIKHAYYSIGDAEGNSKNPAFHDALVNTEKFYQGFETAGIDSKFVLEHGNHFQDSVGRLRRGLEWIVSRY